MAGKTVLVTGATHGLGYETALAIAGMSGRVIITARDETLGNATLEKIKSETGNSDLTLFKVDFTKLQSIRKFAAEFLLRYPKLDVLVNNIGMSTSERRITEDGYEEVFQVNVLGPVLITELLLSAIKAAVPSRIVFVGSDAHKSGRIEFDNLMSERHFGSWKTYANTKLAVMMCALELAEQLEGSGVTLNIAHPGGVRTNIWNNSGLAGKLIGILGAPFMVSAPVGAETQIYLATSPEVEGKTGGYFAKCKSAKLNATALDKTLRKKLWERCSAMLQFPMSGKEAPKVVRTTPAKQSEQHVET
jgi:NAD(P)-dependent dehydrogenase (short-subunit alcohol dehydrogenase family)